ncbi:hypothetical protein LINGRAPRIM_LOCUS2270 [Linum grandiflorum]
MSGRTAATAARHVAKLIPSKHHQRRGIAAGPDHHHKVNFWEDPFTPSKWKPEHFVIVSMTGSGLLIYGGYKYFVQGDTNNNNEVNKSLSLLY